jgi:hypothetical protein
MFSSSGASRIAIAWLAGGTDLSSQAAASRVGILRGNNDNLPALRWYDRAAKKIVSSQVQWFTKASHLDRRAEEG